MSRREAKKYIITIWIFSLILFLPWAFYFKTIRYPSFNQNVETTTNITAQQLVQINEKDNLNLSEINEDALIENIDQNINEKTSFTKQRLLIDDKFCASFKRIIKLNIANSLYRFILKLKIYYLYQISDDDELEDENQFLFFSADNYLNDSFKKKPINLQTANFDQLDRLIKQLDYVSCNCFNKKNLEFLKIHFDKNVKLIARQSSIQQTIALKLNKLLNNSSSRNFESLKLDRLFYLNLNKEFINSQINLANTKQLNVEQLNSLEFSLVKQIKLNELNNDTCKLGCDSLNTTSTTTSLCKIAILFFNQTKLIKNEKRRNKLSPKYR